MKEMHKSRFHFLWMALCCIVPMLLLGGLFFVNIQSSVFKSVLGGLLVLACPLMHIIMMLLMSKGNKDGDNNKGGCH